MDNQPQEQQQNPVVSQPQSVSVPKPKHSKKLPLVLAVALVLIIGAAYGTYAWQHKKVSDSNAKVSSLQSQLSSLQSQVNKLSKQTTAAPATSTTTTTQAATTAPTNYFTIGQWGVKAPYSGSLTLQYVPDSNPSNQMFVNSSQLNAGGPSICTTADGAAGYIGRYLPTDNIPTEGPPGETAQQFISGGGTAPYVKIGSYYYIYFTGQSNGCASTTLLQQTQAAFSALVPKLTSD